VSNRIDNTAIRAVSEKHAQIEQAESDNLLETEVDIMKRTEDWQETRINIGRLRCQERRQKG